MRLRSEIRRYRSYRRGLRCTLLLIVVFLAFQSVSLNAMPVYFAGTGNYYKVVSSSGITWDAARAAASLMSHNGISGRLATITSAPEDLFLDGLRRSALSNEAWVGGFQPAGPSAPHLNWEWISGESFSYTNWLPGEPNDFGGVEKYLALGLGNQYGWNDEGHLGNIGGYLVEFEGRVSEPGGLYLLGVGLILLGCYCQRPGISGPPV